jgi:sulfur-oxidizing protein SoxA
MLAVLSGEALWAAPAGAEDVACAGCHGPPEEMAGAAPRYPAWDEGLGKPVTLTGRVNLCRTRHQGAEPFPAEDPDLLALAALVGVQSRGMAIAPDPDPRMAPWRARGEDLFTARLGQLNLSCAQCHDDHAGGRLGPAPIPEAHPTGYPIYRLQWQEMGSLQRRFGNCLSGVRSTPFPYGADAYVALEAYLMERAAGMPLETPAVRP